MMTLFSLWLLAFGVTVGVAATLTFQWWKGRARWRSIELDDYTARLRALNRPQPKKPSPLVSDRGTRRIP